MIYAYNEVYLDDAMKNLGEAFDFASSVCHLNLDEFLGMFIASGVAKQFGNGNPKYVSGMSGTELVIDVLCKSGLKTTHLDAQIEYECSPEYWVGWSLAYYQWRTRRPFKSIASCITMQEILELYPTHHEASEEKLIETINRIIKSKKLPTQLQIQRKNARLTQKKLAEFSGIKLRTIQQYEMRAKNINKAAAETLQLLAMVLSCNMEDLLEYNLG